MTDDEPEIRSRRLTALTRIASALNVPVAAIYADDRDRLAAIEWTIDDTEPQTLALVRAFGSIRDPVIRDECLAFLQAATQRDALLRLGAPDQVVDGT